MTKTIIITLLDRERILKLINQEKEFGKAKNKEYLKSLEQELNRATILSSEGIPSDVVTMNSQLLLEDLDTGEEMEYSLVYPEDSELLENKISVLAPIGTAILGYREGDIIDWKVPSGIVKLKIKKILYQPESTGNYNL
ncbi:MAG: nucleoside diphosphate kinase regulator [Desulfitobacteriaceae bacterium]|nr:nucleoside diphosphate kinase regulator [Desulfitobacteriaceae bacterium]MDD4346085.1 nucleoside diphosphate kinase regulator [Desulfitobacteriaceae bacterium]MDD4400900.1 nucleoside diphosphate kinase regulator [Desulfitobacteriaceae bacterium]